MRPHFSAEQKAAARALLDMHYPTQDLVAAAVGTTRQSMTTWVNKWNWRFVDFRKADAMRAHDRHRQKLLREHGHNVSGTMPKLGPLDIENFEDAQAQGAAGREEAGMVAAPLVVEPLTPGERAERMSALLLANADMLMSAAERQGGVMNKPQVDTLMTMLRLADKLEAQMAERAGGRQTRTDAELGELYAKVERRIEQRAMAYAAAFIRDAGRDDGQGGVFLPAEAFAQLRDSAAAMEQADEEPEAQAIFPAPQP